MLFFQGNDVRIGQAVQLQGNNSFCLFFREIIADFEVFLGICLVIRSTDKSDDFIEDRNDADQALYDVEASFRLFLIKARASDNDIPTVSNVARQNRNYPNLTRGIIVNRHHIEVVVDLQVCILEQVIQDQICIGIFLELNGNAKTISVRLIPNFGNTGHLIVDTNIVNFLDQDSLVDLIRNLSNDDLLLAAFELLDLCLRADNHPSLTSFIGFLDLIATLDNGTGREIGSRKKLHEFVYLSRRMVDHVDHRIDDFSKVMGRNICRITSRNTRCPIDQKVWKGCRQNRWLFFCIVKVPGKWHCVLFDILKEITSDFR